MEIVWKGKIIPYFHGHKHLQLFIEKVKRGLYKVHQIWLEDPEIEELITIKGSKRRAIKVARRTE